MRRRILRTLLLALVAALGLWVWLTQPARLDPEFFAGIEGDAERGALVFHAAGCANCHAAPDAEGAARLVLAGGQRFASDFGTFVAPNISPDPDHGIGTWTREDFAAAMVLGVSPEGRHYFPAFPYTAYARATAQDVADLWAYWARLPLSERPNEPHEIAFPFGARRNVGLWKTIHLRRDWAVTGDLTELEARGRYLSEALAHCAECHTPRDGLGGLDRSRWLAGAPNPSGQGRIPNITPAALRWSAEDVAAYLSSGFTPDFDVAGGTMALVVDSLSNLPPEDHAAIAAYLRRVAPVE